MYSPYILEKLENLKKNLDEGIITGEEYKTQREVLISKESNLMKKKGGGPDMDVFFKAVDEVITQLIENEYGYDNTKIIYDETKETKIKTFGKFVEVELINYLKDNTNINESKIVDKLSHEDKQYLKDILEKKKFKRYRRFFYMFNT